jgi:hypothetical protein
VDNAARDQLCGEAKLFLSMSEHEGFGVSIVEEMENSVLVFAYEAAAVAETLGEAIVLFREKDPFHVVS